MTNHHLKIQEKFYKKIISWVKTFEIRKNDRNFKKWDTLTFNVITKQESRTWKIWRQKLEITDVFKDENFWLQLGYCILSFKKL